MHTADILQTRTLKFSCSCCLCVHAPAWGCSTGCSWISAVLRRAKTFPAPSPCPEPVTSAVHRELKSLPAARDPLPIQLGMALVHPGSYSCSHCMGQGFPAPWAVLIAGFRVSCMFSGRVENSHFLAIHQD